MQAKAGEETVVAADLGADLDVVQIGQQLGDGH